MPPIMAGIAGCSIERPSMIVYALGPCGVDGLGQDALNCG